jgi:hypothetical protein
MKASIFLFSMMVLFISSCTQPAKSPIEGSWQLVSGRWMDGDSLIGEFPGKLTVSAIKMWSKGHVLFVGQFKSDTIVMDSYGGGPYKLEGNQYEETLQFFAWKSEIGNTVKMVVEIKNDTLIQTWPLGTNGQVDKSNFNQEKYIRLD